MTPGLGRSSEGVFAELSCNCVLLSVLGHYGESLCLSWGALWPHFFVFGTPCGLILALLGPLGKPFWPKFAQVGPRWVKKHDFLNLTSRFGTQVAIQNGEKSMSKTMFFLDAFLTSNFIDFSTILDLNFGCILDRFLDSNRKCRFFKN